MIFLTSREINVAIIPIIPKTTRCKISIPQGLCLTAAPHLPPPCRHCKSCTRMCLRMTTSWSWCQETSSSRLRWSRAAPVRAGCTAPRWARGCRACCLRTTSTALMSPTPGSSTGKERKRGVSIGVFLELLKFLTFKGGALRGPAIGLLDRWVVRTVQWQR